MNTPPIKDFHVLRTIDELRAMADEVRIEMLRLLSLKPHTGSMLAREIGMTASRAHYHVGRLVDAGLATPVVESRHGEWKGERHFIATARHFLADPELACQDPETSAVVSRSIEQAFLDWHRSQLAIDWSPLAERLAQRTLRVSQGEHVLVAFRPGVLELAEAIVVEIEALGAIAHLRPWSDNVITRTLDRHDADTLARRPFLPEEIDRLLHAVVLVTSSLGRTAPTSARREKLPHLLRSMTRWHQSIRARRLRYVEVALPHRAEFEQGSMTIEESIDAFWRCVEADTDVLHDRGERLRAHVDRNPNVRIWGPPGTDLRVRVDPEQTHVSDGVVSPEDVRRGRCSEFVPTGGVSLLPVRGSAEGTIHAGYTASQGRHYRNVSIQLRGGRITHIEAEEGTDALRDQIARAVGEPDFLSGIGIGINAQAAGATGKPNLDSHLAGVITIAFGNNELAGGDVSSTLTLIFPVWGLSMSAGDETLVREGRLSLSGPR